MNVTVSGDGTTEVIEIRTELRGPQGDPGTTDYNELENLPDLTLKADKATTYTKVEVDTALAGKAETIHVHTIADVTGLQSALDGKSATNHTHTAANITDFDAEVSNNIDVAANTAARHTHANKAILDATTASYTTADETKLDGIEAGAQVNTVTSVAGKTGAVTLDKTDVGLSNVDNTSDASKPISTATQTALDAKATTTALTTHTSNTSNPHSVTKAQVGLGNVDNTSDANKPVSTATQTALNLKANTSALAPVATSGSHSSLTGLSADDHPQYHNDDRGDARYAGQPYAVMAKAKFASLASSYGMLGKIFGNSGYINDLQIYGESTQASVPTPDVPVPIVSTTGNVTVRSASPSKNLFDAGVGITIGFYYDGGGTAIASASDFIQTAYIPVLPNTTYTMSHAGNAIPMIVQYSSNQTFNSRTFATSANSVTVTTASNTAFVRLSGAITQLATTQFELGAVATAFVPHNVSTQTLPLATTQLRSLPNGVSDRIYKSGSSWYLEQNVGTFTANGTSQTWTVNSALTNMYRFVSHILVGSTGGSTLNMMSDRFLATASTDTSDTEHVRNSSSSSPLAAIFYINKSRLTANTSAAFNTWLAANPTTITFPLATPIAAPITDPTLITALENIRTYQGITNITASTPVSGSYGLDLNTAFATKTENATKLSKTGDTATGKMTFNGGIAIADNQNIELSATTGTRIGTSTTQKLGFYNATPVVRPTGTPANATDLATAISLANNLKAKLIALGLIS